LKFQALKLRRGYKRAIVSVGHKLLRTVYYMLSREQSYRDSSADYEAMSVQRNAPRWFKALNKFDYIKPVQA
jgi:hypothetical protein